MKIGFIGIGNMAQAIIGGIVEHNVFPAENITAYDINQSTLHEASVKFRIEAADNNQELIANCDLIFFAVKPQYFGAVANEIKGSITKEKGFVSIMAGVSNDMLKGYLGVSARILRCMPNLPLTVGEGMTCLCKENGLTQEEFDLVQAIFSSIGKIEVLPEKDICAFAAIAGSSPAYVFMMIEAMADAACMAGIPRSVAYPVCSQAVLGSAKLALESPHHVAELKDMVCSPGGTTIEGVYALESGKFRQTVMDSILAAIRKFNEMQESK